MINTRKKNPVTQPSDFWQKVAISLAKKLLILAAMVGSLIFTIHLLGYGRYLTISHLLRAIHSVPDNWYVFALFQAIYLLGSWVLFPLTATTILALIVFPLWKAILAATLGVFLSGTLTYLAGRVLFKINNSRKYKKHLVLIQNEFERYGYWAVTALRLAPQPPFVVTSVLCGSLKFNYLKYLGATYLGLAPMLLLTFVLGQQTMTVMREPSTVAISILIGVAILVPVFLKFKKGILKKTSINKSC